MGRHFMELTLYSAYSLWGELDFVSGFLVGAKTILRETTGFLLESLVFPNTLDNDSIFPSELPVPLIEKKNIFLVASSYQSSQLLMSTDGLLNRNIRTCRL